MSRDFFDSNSGRVTEFGENEALRMYETPFANMIGETPREEYRPKCGSGSRRACEGRVGGLWKIFKIGGR